MIFSLYTYIFYFMHLKILLCQRNNRLCHTAKESMCRKQKNGTSKMSTPSYPEPVCYCIWQRGLCRHDYVKVIKMGRLSWINYLSKPNVIIGSLKEEGKSVNVRKEELTQAEVGVMCLEDGGRCTSRGTQVASDLATGAFRWNAA